MDTTLPGVAEPSAAALTRAQKRAIVAATLGTVVEFTDWIIYATFAALFSRHFFPAHDERVSLLSAFAVFAVGFIMRPIGGALLGAYADRHGRKNGLALSVALMAGSSLVIAACPSYQSIGFTAPVILVLARLVQGFAAGGEFGSASTFLIESSAPSRRGFAGSWQHFAVNAGVLVAASVGALLTSIIQPSGMAEYGWRIAFGIAGLMGFVALWVRLAVAETDAFKKVARHGHVRHPFVSIVRDHRRAALRVVGIAMAGNLCIYLWLVLFPTLAHLRTGLPLSAAFRASVISIVVSLIAIPFIGMLSDRIGRKPILLVFAGGSALFAWPALECDRHRHDRHGAVVGIRRDVRDGDGRTVSRERARNGRRPAVCNLGGALWRHAALHRHRDVQLGPVAIPVGLRRRCVRRGLRRVCAHAGDARKDPRLTLIFWREQCEK